MDQVLLGIVVASGVIAGRLTTRDRILIQLYGQDESPDELKRLLGVSRQLLALRLRDLLQEDLVTRCKAMDHRRSRFYRLTKKGRDTVDNLFADLAILLPTPLRPAKLAADIRTHMLGKIDRLDYYAVVRHDGIVKRIKGVADLIL